MKIVDDESKLGELYSLARLEAKKYFEMMRCILKNILKSLDIEVQVLSGKIERFTLIETAVFRENIKN